jgi:signal peptidase I
LGDNRDVSNDSRFMGRVADEDVVGKVTGVWLSDELGRSGTTFP